MTLQYSIFIYIQTRTVILTIIVTYVHIHIIIIITTVAAFIVTVGVLVCSVHLPSLYSFKLPVYDATIFKCKVMFNVLTRFLTTSWSFVVFSLYTAMSIIHHNNSKAHCTCIRSGSLPEKLVVKHNNPVKFVYSSIHYCFYMLRSEC